LEKSGFGSGTSRQPPSPGAKTAAPARAASAEGAGPAFPIWISRPLPALTEGGVDSRFRGRTYYATRPLRCLPPTHHHSPTRLKRARRPFVSLFFFSFFLVVTTTKKLFLLQHILHALNPVNQKELNLCVCVCVFLYVRRPK
jgi:hypothetical protein